MRVGSYEVNVRGADDKPVADRDDGTIGLAHGEPIGIVLGNSTEKRAAAFIEVDGSSIGAWIVPAYGQIVIERPAEIDRRLTFFAQGTTEAQTNMLDLVAPEDQGVVRVTFKPEKAYTPPPAALFAFRSVTRGSDMFGGGQMRGGGFESRGMFDFGSLQKSQTGGADGNAEPGGSGNDQQDTARPANAPEGSSQTESQAGLKAGGIGLGARSEQQFMRGHLEIDNEPTKHVVISIRLGLDEARLMPAGPTQNFTPAPFGGGPGSTPRRPPGSGPVTGEPASAPCFA